MLSAASLDTLRDMAAGSGRLPPWHSSVGELTKAGLVTWGTSTPERPWLDKFYVISDAGHVALAQDAGK